MAGIGWIFGYMIDGTQAEYVRVPFAENSVYKVPEGMTDAEGILLSDILPTGFEIGVQYGHVQPGRRRRGDRLRARSGSRRS